jgi:hypothetical protein
MFLRPYTLFPPANSDRAESERETAFIGGRAKVNVGRGCANDGASLTRAPTLTFVSLRLKALSLLRSFTCWRE